MADALVTPTQATSDGRCNFDLSGDKADTVFAVLGMLDECAGRVIVDGSDRVESFYREETTAAQRFERLVRRLSAEQDIADTVVDDTSQSSGHVYRSAPIAQRLNSCYRYTLSNERLSIDANAAGHPTASPHLEHALFDKPTTRLTLLTERGVPDERFQRRRALAYLAGAWSRYGVKGSFVFANAEPKARLIASLLDELGSDGIRIETTVGQAPAGVWVHFRPTREVREWLSRD